MGTRGELTEKLGAGENFEKGWTPMRINLSAYEE